MLDYYTTSPAPCQELFEKYFTPQPKTNAKTPRCALLFGIAGERAYSLNSSGSVVITLSIFTLTFFDLSVYSVSDAVQITLFVIITALFFCLDVTEMGVAVE